MTVYVALSGPLRQSRRKKRPGPALEKSAGENQDEGGLDDHFFHALDE
jgi:hypothetical protein